MIAGAALLVLAAWSPFALLRLIPMMEVAAASVVEPALVDVRRRRLGRHPQPRRLHAPGDGSATRGRRPHPPIRDDRRNDLRASTHDRAKHGASDEHDSRADGPSIGGEAGARTRPEQTTGSAGGTIVPGARARPSAPPTREAQRGSPTSHGAAPPHASCRAADAAIRLAAADHGPTGVRLDDGGNA